MHGEQVCHNKEANREDEAGNTKRNALGKKGREHLKGGRGGARNRKAGADRQVDEGNEQTREHGVNP